MSRSADIVIETPEYRYIFEKDPFENMSPPLTCNTLTRYAYSVFDKKKNLFIKHCFVKAATANQILWEAGLIKGDLK